MRLIDDDREALAGGVDLHLAVALQPGRRPRDERELLDGGDDDRRALPQGTGELAGVFIDLLDHAGLVLELVDGVLQLLIEHAPVRDHNHRVEDLFINGVVQIGKPVGASQAMELDLPEPAECCAR